jgi:hypothetical protein
LLCSKHQVYSIATTDCLLLAINILLSMRDGTNQYNVLITKNTTLYDTVIILLS